MPKLELKKPVVTIEPVLTVDGGLPPGRRRLQLEVENEQGKRSKPAEIVIVVKGPNP